MPVQRQLAGCRATRPPPQQAPDPAPPRPAQRLARKSAVHPYARIHSACAGRSSRRRFGWRHSWCGDGVTLSRSTQCRRARGASRVGGHWRRGGPALPDGSTRQAPSDPREHPVIANVSAARTAHRSRAGTTAPVPVWQNSLARGTREGTGLEFLAEPDADGPRLCIDAVDLADRIGRTRPAVVNVAFRGARLLAS